MVYNRFTYNSALFNSGRDEAGSVIRSIIQAHTGPHIRAVVGADPRPNATQDGISFISDFDITEGTIKKPPTSFNFPDLQARINAVKTNSDLLLAIIFGQAARDLPAAIYLTNRIPDLPASIFALLQTDLGADIFGTFMYKDLLASILARPIFTDDLPACINLVYPYDLRGRITGQTGGNLGAIIWSPKDLSASIAITFGDNLTASVLGMSFKNLPARMLGIPGPSFRAFIRGSASAVANLPSAIHLLSESPDLPASINSTYPGPNDFLADITAIGHHDNMSAVILSAFQGVDNLGALIKTGGEVDLPAIIDFLGALNITATIGTIPFGVRNRELPAFAQSVHPADLGAVMTINRNTAFLGAFIEALSDTKDLGAFIRAAETFITAIFTVSTMSARNLRAVIGRPECDGGSAIKELSATAIAKNAKNLLAVIISFAQHELGASVNTPNIIHAMDVINVRYSPRRDKKTKVLRSTDSIAIRYSPFRGKNLGAAITGTLTYKDLNARVAAGFPLPRVVPTLSRLTAADLRNGGENLNIQEIRLQLEGRLVEFIYVNGTDDAFIRDSEEQWRINVRSFQPIAANLFGDFAVARICRRGDIQSFATIDAAVRACIGMVLGLEGQLELGASITAAGGYKGLRALVGVSDTYDDLHAIAGRVFPSDFGAMVNGTGDINDLIATVAGVGADASDLSASIYQESNGSLAASITGV